MSLSIPTYRPGPPPNPNRGPVMVADEEEEEDRRTMRRPNESAIPLRNSTLRR